MPIAETLLPEFDHEMATTRKLLERLPEAQASWKPHPRSWNLGQLALHIVNLPTWVGMARQKTEFDLSPPGGASTPPRQFESAAATLRLFDENVKNARAAIAAASDDDFRVKWTLKKAGAPVFSLPRAGV